MQVLRALEPLSVGLAVAFLIFLLIPIGDALPSGRASWLVSVTVGSIAALLVLFVALRRRKVARHWANPLSLGVVSLGLFNILAVFSLTRAPLYLDLLIIVTITCGAVLLSWRWLLGALGLTFATSVPWALALLPSTEHFRYWLVLTAASAVAAIILAVRRREVLAAQQALFALRTEAARRSQAERYLRESEKSLELAIAGSQGGWWEIKMDPENPGLIPDAINLDPSLKSFIGFEDDEFPNSRTAWGDRILPQDRIQCEAAMQKHLAGETPLYEIEYRIRHRSGTIRWLYVRGRVWRDEAGRPVRWSGLDWDITATKRTESRLKLLTRAVEQSPSLVIITDTDGSIEYVNPKLLRTTGYSVDEVIGRKPSLFKSDQTPRETWDGLWRAISAGEEWQGEFRNRRKDGSDYLVIASVSPIKNVFGVTEHYLAVQEDVTERRKIEAQLAQAQKLESVGQLVSGVAHDFNNLLTAVIGFAELGMSRVEEGEPPQGELEEIKKAGTSAGSLTRQLLAFSRQQILEPRVLCINDVVTEVQRLLRRTISEDIELVQSLDPELGAARVDVPQMTQVLVNLAINARDAMPDGGRLTIETRNVRIDDLQIVGVDGAVAGAYVLLAVSDDGSGIDEETQARVFEPFFTTKERGHGSGLGLSTVYGVVKQSGGFVTLYSEPGVGTTFNIYLPRVEEMVEALETGAIPEVRSGNETILVVEDNSGVRKVAARTLESRGYRVLACEGAEEACRRFAEESVDLLLTDVVMPGTNGATLAQELKRQKASLKVLLMSGYAERAVLDAQDLDVSTPFIHKPFRLDDLLVKVRSCLDGGHELE